MASEPKSADELAKPDAAEEELTEPPPKLTPRRRLAQFLAQLRKPPTPTREMKSGERTRGLVILIGASVACVILFFGLFTTDSGLTRKERRTKPNLGRPEPSAASSEAPARSPVPQLAIGPSSGDEPNELTEKDVLGTMRNRTATSPAKKEPAANPTLGSVNFDDPALTAAYRRRGLVPPQRTEIANWEDPPQKPAPPATTQPLPSASESLRKSSIVFVRTSTGSALQQTVGLALDRGYQNVLPQGTALVARLQHAVSSAAKVPVIAVIEYNYETDGRLIVPAGTKAYGELSQATPQGWVNLKFQTLELPNGETEKINGSALSMDRSVLRGDVSGRNGGKKFLTRAMTGLGTIAAFAVGGRGLSGTIDNSVLLRERIASNVALSGEQELAALAYQQNIVVTVPANTRFYLVLHEAGVAKAAELDARPASSTVAAASTSSLSEHELQEAIQLRNEMREMNRLMQLNVPKAERPPEND